MARRRKTPVLVDIQCESSRGLRDFRRLALGGVDPVNMYGKDAGVEGWWLPDAPERMPDRFHQLLRATGCRVADPLRSNAAQPEWLVPALIGGAVLGGLLLFSGGSIAGGKKSCPVDAKKFEAWLIEKQLAGECAPELASAPTNYKALQQAGLAPAEFYPYVLVLGDGSFWYYSDPSSPGAKSENLRSQYATFAGGSLKGHPADMFMVM